MKTIEKLNTMMADGLPEDEKEALREAIATMSQKPMDMISSHAAATLRMCLMGRREAIEKLYQPGTHEHMRQVHNLAHLEHELGIEEKGIND